MANENQIRTLVVDQLSSFNLAGVPLTDDTILDDVFAGDGELADQAPLLFEGNILWTLNKNNHTPQNGGKNTFPSGWRSLTVAELVKRLLIFIIVFSFAFTSKAQLDVNISTVKTDLKNTALNFAFSYIHSLDSLYGGKDYLLSGRQSYLIITPDIQFQSGTQDAFSSIVAKATGLFSVFKTKTIAGLITPDANKTIQVFPVSVGIETNAQFSFINTIAEIGYQPFYQSPLSKTPDWLRHTKFGIYLQAGHKFKTGQDTISKGGLADQSQEQVGGSIFRAKGVLIVDTKKLIQAGGLSMGLVGSSNLWYDALHAAWYYKLQGTARVFLTNTTYLDLNIDRGSGAPNFNQGDQFGVGLTIKF